jgi:hypothetical protein
MPSQTLSGLLEDRPPAAENIGKYYFATDENEYYKSAGDAWLKVATPDLDDIAPDTQVVLVAAKQESDNTLDVLKTDDDGYLLVNVAAGGSSGGSNEPIRGALTFASGGVGQGSAQVFAANSSRNYLMVQNTGGEVISVRVGGNTGEGGFQLQPNGGAIVWENNFVPDGVVWVWNSESSGSWAAAQG